MRSTRGTFPHREGVLRSFDQLGEAESALVLAMRTHPTVAQWMTTGGTIDAEHHAAFMARQADDDRNVNYLVCDSEGCLGVVSLHRIDHKNGLAFVGIYHNPFDARSRLGRRLLSALCRQAFKHAGLHSLKLEVAADNARAISLYERYGFSHEGRWRESVRRPDGFVDLLAMGLLDREWNDA